MSNPDPRETARLLCCRTRMIGGLESTRVYFMCVGSKP